MHVVYSGLWARLHAQLRRTMWGRVRSVPHSMWRRAGVIGYALT
jgi:hypothetical protein